ncbi:MAG: hypothetical protein A2W03_01150 [Candidatus Aminicenantes bacterium RBG_16_63_16]|nr:MAG: hypothetical protein A2W03_01150 [Candidatus Aminicenantes bacterium RBG_16_63_16]
MPNRLIREKSAYLLQHAGNPVDWYPWGEEAFAAAGRLNRPVFLSIGYSSCHWCHVMARESFEDAETARLLNEGFVSIKVDREERPDIDAHYMAACQMLSGSGGWPLSVFLTADRQPFFAGTYFPRDSRFGLIGFKDLVLQIAGAWKAGGRDLLGTAEKIVAALRQTVKAPPGEPLGPEILDDAFTRLSAEYDPVHGGFGGAPKFPLAHRLFFLLRYAGRTGNRRALEMVEKTLLEMRRGGIFDQLGFGFHRYSTDAGWRVPHFEKMLYDQALLAMAYTEAYQVTGRPEFRRTVEETASYVLRELVSPEGGFFTSEDADSGGEEGLFYLWEAAEIRSSLTPAEAEFAGRVFGPHSKEDLGTGAAPALEKRVLRLGQEPSALVEEMGISRREFHKRLASVRTRLLAVRERRPRPHKDTKILTDWNGLMIAALAKAAGALGRDRLTSAARKAIAFIRGHLYSGGRLRHRYAGGEAAVTAFLDDYAFLIWGLVEVYETGFDPDALAWALRLTDDLMDGFWDEARGGFFMTHRGNRDLPWRRKDFYDGAVPSGNSIMVGNLLRMGRLTGRSDLEKAAGKIVDFSAGSISRNPAAHTQFLCGLDFAFGPSHEIVIIGTPNDPDTRRLLEPLRKRFLPRATVVFCPAGAGLPPIFELAPYARAMTAVEGRPTAYVCSGFHCESPTTDPEILLNTLEGGGSRSGHEEK